MRGYFQMCPCKRDHAPRTTHHGNKTMKSEITVESSRPKFGRFPPCQPVNSLLITLSESGKLDRRLQAGLRSPAIQAFAIFRHRPKDGARFCANVKSISWG